MKRLLLLFISLTFIAVAGESVQACSCVEYDVPVCAAYWRADAVFAGQLIEIKPAEPGSQNQMPTAMLHFIVEQPFRGVNAGKIEVETLHGTSCDMKFEKGERYLIYATLNRGGKQLFAPPCTRTELLKHAEQDLEYIRTLKNGEIKETIIGRLVENKYRPLPGLKVTITRDGKTLAATTDAKGDFSVAVPGPGDYTVRVFIPFAAAVMAYSETEQGKIEATDTLTTFEYPVKVEKTECQFRTLDTFRIDLHATAEVSGNLLTATGRPVSVGYVYLVNAADKDDSVSQKVEEDGSFRFEGVAVGEYYLVLNPWNKAPDEDDPPYPRTYYLNVSDSGAATKIVVTEGVKIGNLTLRLGRPLKERTVTGRVLWQDGTAPTKAHISVYTGEQYVRMVDTDESGKFSFKLYGDFKYSLTARVWGTTAGESERTAVPDRKSTGISLTLKRSQ